MRKIFRAPYEKSTIRYNRFTSKGCNVIKSAKRFSFKAFFFFPLFLISVSGFAKVYYVEMDRAFSVEEIMASLSEGFKVELYEQKKTDVVKHIYKIESQDKDSLAKQIPKETVKRVSEVLSL